MLRTSVMKSDFVRFDDFEWLVKTILDGKSG